MVGGGQIGFWPDKPPEKRQLQALIRGLVDSGARIGLSDDAENFLLTNDLDMSDVIRGFRAGSILGPIKAGKDENEWECTVVAPIPRFPKAKQEIGIVTVVIEATSLLVGRVKWASGAT